MNRMPVQKIARILNVLVLITLICNLIALFLVPVAVMQHDTLLVGIGCYLSHLLQPGEDNIVMAAVAGSFLAWVWVWQEPYNLMLALFLLFSGTCTAIILWQGRRVLQTILLGTPFSLENAVSLHRAAVCAFLIAFAAAVRVVFNIILFQSIRPLLSYNALFIPIFSIAGLLCLVMSALFRQAVALKEENDLTI